MTDPEDPPANQDSPPEVTSPSRRHWREWWEQDETQGDSRKLPLESAPDLEAKSIMLSIDVDGRPRPGMKLADLPDEVPAGSDPIGEVWAVAGADEDKGVL